jgi:hypothetical protein
MFGVTTYDMMRSGSPPSATSADDCRVIAPTGVEVSQTRL